MAKDNVIQTYNINSQEVFPRVLIDSVVSDDGKESGASVIGKSLAGTDLHVRNLILDNAITEGTTLKSYVKLETSSDTAKSGVTLDIVTVNSDSDQKSYLNINDKQNGGSCNFNGYFNDSLIRNTGYIDVSAKKLIVNANEDGIDASAAKIHIDTNSITGTTGDVSMDGGKLQMKYTNVSIGKISELQFDGDSVISSSNNRGIKMESKNASIDVGSSIELDSNIVNINCSNLSINKIKRVQLDCSSVDNCMATLLDVSVDMQNTKITTNAELLCNKLRQLGTQTTYNTYVTRSIENKNVQEDTNISTNINTEYRDNFKFDKFNLDIKRIYDASIGYQGKYEADWSYKFAVNDDVYFKIDKDSLRGKVNNQNDVLLGMPIGSIVMWMRPNNVNKVKVPNGWELIKKEPVLISRKFYDCQFFKRQKKLDMGMIYYYFYDKKSMEIKIENEDGGTYENTKYSALYSSYIDNNNISYFDSSLTDDIKMTSVREDSYRDSENNNYNLIANMAIESEDEKEWITDSKNNKNKNICGRMPSTSNQQYFNTALELFYEGIKYSKPHTSGLMMGFFDSKWYYEKVESKQNEASKSKSIVMSTGDSTIKNDVVGEIGGVTDEGVVVNGMVCIERYLMFDNIPTTYSYIMKVE